MPFHDIARIFPLIIAPGIIAYARRRWPSLVTNGALDGLVVWLFVVLAAVLFSLLVDFAFGSPVTLDALRRGVLLGVTSAAAHTLATGKGRPVRREQEPSVPAVVVDADKTRVAPRADLDF